MVLVLILSGCGIVATDRATAPTPTIHAEKGAVAAPVGPTPANWSTDHRTVSNLAQFVKSTAGTGPAYVASFPYKLASDTLVVRGLLYVTSGDVYRLSITGGFMWVSATLLFPARPGAQTRREAQALVESRCFPHDRGIPCSISRPVDPTNSL